MAFRKDYAASRAGILKYVEMGLSFLVLALSGVTATGFFSYTAIGIVGVCFVGCVVLYVMRLFDCVQHECEFYFLIAATLGTLCAAIVIFVGSGDDKNKNHKGVFIVSGCCALVVCILFLADLIIGKWFRAKLELGVPHPPAGGEKIAKSNTAESDQPPA